MAEIIRFLPICSVLIVLAAGSLAKQARPNESLSRDNVFDILTAETNSYLKELRLNETQCGFDSYLLLSNNSCVSCEMCSGENYRPRCGTKCQVYRTMKERNSIAKSLGRVKMEIAEINQTVSQILVQAEDRASYKVSVDHVSIWPSVIASAVVVAFPIICIFWARFKRKKPTPVVTTKLTCCSRVQATPCIQRPAKPIFNNRADAFKNVPPVGDNPV